jgi:hypothetical protein
MRGKTIAKIVVAAVIVGSAYSAFKDDIAKLCQDLHVRVAEYPTPKKTVWLKQNVSKEELNRFYHTDQGTRTFGMPYEWFMALEQPTIPWLVITAAPPFNDPAYLDRYGFIRNTILSEKKEKDKEEMPIGFAKGGPMLDSLGNPWRNPRTKKDMSGIGLTCAGCHTGRFTYKETAVVVDGGSALTDLFKLKQGMGVALLYTRVLPGRFARFADNILGEASTVDDREALKFQLDQALTQYKQVKDLEQNVAAQSLPEGYGRLDALNRIGNQVFSLDLKKPENYVGSTAPVHYPRIWNTPWFDWVQYNGSIMQPMVRNAGESLGVSAELNLTNPSKGLFKSSVSIDDLHWMEQMIAGKAPTVEKGFSGLASPLWPEDVLPKIDWALAEKGSKLYIENCQGCHRPPVSLFQPPAAGQARQVTPNPAFFNFANEKAWRTNQIGQPVLLIETIPVDHIGTDLAQATDMANRKVALTPELDIKETKFANALKVLVEKTVNVVYDQRKLDQKKRDEFNGNMPNEIQDGIAYKVRPLNGVWATPPYLHNGSVPTVYDLLSPVDERPKDFWLGNREYDPEKLGYKSEKITNGFYFNTLIRGNRNTGHEFNDKPKGTEGVIGRKLAPDERKALIEYLKTL